MQIIVNGKPRKLADKSTIKSFLDDLKLKPETVAIELNLEIVSKKEYDLQLLKEGDKVEIISFVGGG